MEDKSKLITPGILLIVIGVAIILFMLFVTNIWLGLFCTAIAIVIVGSILFSVGNGY